jgi:hypothetical protein
VRSAVRTGGVDRHNLMSRQESQRSRSGPHDESGHVVDEAAHFSIEIAVANSKGRPLTSDDFPRKLERAHRLDEDVETYLGSECWHVARHIQPSSRSRYIHERSGALAFAGRAENVESSLKARMCASIHGISQEGSGFPYESVRAGLCLRPGAHREAGSRQSLLRKRRAAKPQGQGQARALRSVRESSFPVPTSIRPERR